MTPKLTLVKADDWEGLYVDGVLKCQGHEVSLGEVMIALNLPLIPSVWVDEDWLLEEGELPDRLEDVKKDAD